MRFIEASVTYEGEPATLFYDADDDPLFGGWGLERADGAAVFRPLEEILQLVTDEEDASAVRARVEPALLSDLKKVTSSATSVAEVREAVERADEVLEQVRVYEQQQPVGL